VLAAPTPCILSTWCADVTGRNNSGAMQIKRAKVCTARKSKAGSQSRSDAMKNQNDNQTQDLLKGTAMQAIQFIDEVKDAPLDANNILTDDQLGRAGLVKIEAFVRTKTSAAASRKAKQRAKEKAEGIQTVTLTVPTAAKEQLKAVAAEVANGKSLVEAVQSVTSHGQVTKSHAQIIGERVLALTSWKLIIAKAIGIL